MTTENKLTREEIFEFFKEFIPNGFSARLRDEELNDGSCYIYFEGDSFKIDTELNVLQKGYAPAEYVYVNSKTRLIETALKYAWQSTVYEAAFKNLETDLKQLDLIGVQSNV